MEPGNLLTVPEAAQLLSVKPRTIYAWVQERRIPFRRAGRLLRFDRADLLAWAASQAQENLQPSYLRMIG
jgi:excisionase family DNA binding protein